MWSCTSGSAVPVVYMLRGVSPTSYVPFKVGKRQPLFVFVCAKTCGTAPVSAPHLFAHVVAVVKDSQIKIIVKENQNPS